MRIADRQNWSLSEARRKISSSELMLWAAYLEWDMNAFHREDFYQAQIAQTVARVLSKSPKQIKLDHFLLEFKSSKKKETKKPTTEDEKQRYIDQSKAFWMGISSVGMDPKNRK